MRAGSKEQHVNRTASSMNPEGTAELVKVTESIPPSSPGDGRQIHALRNEYSAEGEILGHMPKGGPARGKKAGLMAMLLDKMGERLAFERTGVRPFVYTHYAFAREGHCDGLDVLPLWLAAPGYPKGDPLVPEPWLTWTIHQYANSPVDQNVFDGTRGRLVRLGKRRRRPVRALRRRDRRAGRDR